MWQQIVFNSLVSSSIYVLVALGLALVFGTMGILNFAHGAMYMLGGYAFYVLARWLGLNYILAAITSALVVGALGVIAERIFLRPMRGQLFQLFVITLSLSIIFETAIEKSFGLERRAVSIPISGIVNLGRVTASWERIAIILFAAALVWGLFIFLGRAKAGQAMRAVGENSEAAALQGIDPDKIASLCMFIGCALAGAAATLTAPVFAIDPYMGTSPLLKGFIIMILGGVGSIPGAVVGGLVLGFVDNITTALFHGGEIASLIGFGLVMLILLARPKGLLGHE